MRCRDAVFVVLMLVPFSTLSTQSGLEIRAGFIGQLSHRNAELEQQLGTGSGTLIGFEGQARWRMIGGWVRGFGGRFSADSSTEAAGTIRRLDLNVTAGPTVLAADVGYALRSYSGAFGTRRWSFVRVGGHSNLPLGATDLRASVLAAIYVGVSGSDDSGGGSGGEAETRLTYAPDRLPLYASLGYRFERFTVSDESEIRAEELSGIVFTIGVLLRL
jgi:hypothetical protein